MSTPKYCVDCKWCEKTRDLYSGCGHPKVAWANKYFRVTGKVENGCYAADERTKRLFGKCGPAGKLWESR